MPAMTRGPLPAAVYWRRRAAVLGIVLLLLIGVTRMFGSGEEEPTARQASSATSTPPVVPDHVGAVDPGTTDGTDTTAANTDAAAGPSVATTAPTAPTTTLAAPSTVLPTPTGRCSDDDVSVAASVPKAEATRTVVVVLDIRTKVQAACLWRISPKTLQVEISSGSDQLWTSLQCPRAIPTKELTLRRDTPVTVAVRWNSRRSDEDCSTHTQWALPGYYHVKAAALGGEPVDVQFRLTKPVRVVAPKPTASATPTAEPGASTTKKNPKKKGARSEPTGVPSVNPD